MTNKALLLFMLSSFTPIIKFSPAIFAIIAGYSFRIDSVLRLWHKTMCSHKFGTTGFEPVTLLCVSALSS